MAGEPEAYQCHGGNVGPIGTLRKGNGGVTGGVTGGVPFVAQTEQQCVVGPLTTGGTPNGHGMAGVNRQAVQAGHVVACLDPQTFTEDGSGHQTYKETEIACPLRSGSTGGSYANNVGMDPVVYPIQDCRAIEKQQGRLGVDLSESNVSYTLDSLGEQGVACEAPIAFHATQTPISGDVSPAIGQGNQQGCATVGVLAFQERGRDGGRNLETQEDIAYALTSPKGGGRSQERNILAPEVSSTLSGGTGGGCGHQYRQKGNEDQLITDRMTVRRLTPTECARLQGAPDWWADIDPPLSDSAKYKMWGNAGGVPVLTWIGLGIQATENGWLDDPDFAAIREAVCRSDDPLARDVILDWMEEKTGHRPVWKMEP